MLAIYVPACSKNVV